MPGPESTTTPGAAGSEDPTKRCPYCAEVIKAAAVRCRYCQSDLPVTDGAPVVAEPVTPAPEPPPAPAPLDREPDPSVPGRGRSLVPLVAGAVALVLVLVFLALAFRDWQKVRDLQESEDAGRTVRATVTDKVEALLSYDFQSFDKDLEAAQEGMTDSFREEYDPTVEEIRDRALAQRRSQDAQVVAVALLSATPDEVRTLLFVNTVSTRAGTDKQRIMQNRVTVTMVKQGDEWLIDELSVPQS